MKETRLICVALALLAIASAGSAWARGGHGGRSGSAGYGCVVWCSPAGGIIGELPAVVIIVAELLEAPAGARQSHHARTCRNARAPRDKACRKQRR